VEFEEYRIMYEAEDTHWWYRGVHISMLTLLGLTPKKHKNLRILDAGCGTGGNLQFLSDAGYERLEGFDYSEHALYFCRKRGLTGVKHGSATDIPFPSNSYPVVISCDMLNDTGIKDEHAALKELYRVLKPGGKLFLNLPALSFLAGEHDLATSVARRYTRRSISDLLSEEGFTLKRVTYRNMLLFPLIFIVRKLRSARDNAASVRSDIELPPSPINTLLTTVMRLEAFLLRYVDLPIGSSVSVVAVKPPADR
jgi:SAM-dependent methyltransferase